MKNTFYSNTVCGFFGMGWSDITNSFMFEYWFWQGRCYEENEHEEELDTHTEICLFNLFEIRSVQPAYIPQELAVAMEAIKIKQSISEWCCAMCLKHLTISCNHTINVNHGSYENKIQIDMQSTLIGFI